MQGVFDSGLSFFHFHFTCSTDIDLSHTAGKFSQSFLELLTVIVTGCNFYFVFYLLDSAVDTLLAARTFNNDCIVVVDGYLFGLAKLLYTDVFHLDA